MSGRRRPVEPLSRAVASGDYRRGLEALRDRLTAAIEAVENPRDVAPLAARLTDVLRTLNDLPAAKEASRVDDLAYRRAARRAAAPGQ